MLDEALEELEAPPAVNRIGTADSGQGRAKGFADFGAFRTDVIVLCLLYAIGGLVLARVAFGRGLLPLIFPLASGFTLARPAIAVGLGPSWQLSARDIRRLHALHAGVGHLLPGRG